MAKDDFAKILLGIFCQICTEIKYCTGANPDWGSLGLKRKNHWAIQPENGNIFT